MGLFGSLFSQKKKTVAKRGTQTVSDKSIAQLRAEREADDRHFNMVMDKVNSASEACKDTDNSDDALEEYRRVIEWAREEGVNLSTAHDFRLINGYIKMGKHDAAWGYLNAMSMKHPDDL